MINWGGFARLRNLSVGVVCAIAICCGAIASFGRAPSTSVAIVNQSGREIRNVYLSHVSVDDWSSDQLGDATIAAGQTYTLSNVACDQQQVKVIAEDQDGCFMSTTVNCGDAATWTINGDTPRDCGY